MKENHSRNEFVKPPRRELSSEIRLEPINSKENARERSENRSSRRSVRAEITENSVCLSIIDPIRPQSNNNNASRMKNNIHKIYT